jgi:hypothetical protein
MCLPFLLSERDSFLTGDNDERCGIVTSGCDRNVAEKKNLMERCGRCGRL